MTATERVLIAAIAGLFVVTAAGLTLAAFRPSPPPGPRRRMALSRSVAGLASATGLLVLVVTRWPVAAAATAVLVVVWSSLFQSTAATGERRRVTAIAKWLEDLRDLQRGSNLDLPQALDRSATRAPKDIAAELGRFVDRVRHHTPLEEALLGLAAELDHPSADQAIAAMLFAHGHASGSVLYATFEELAASARDELTARDQIDRVRARFESSMRRMLVILAVLIGYLLVAARDTIGEYETPAGQAWLVVPIGIWAVALWWLRRLARYQRGGRYLDYAAVSTHTTGARR